MFQGSTPALELSFTTIILPASEAMRKIRAICDICVTYCFCVRLDRASPPRAKQAENLQDLQDFAMRKARAGVLAPPASAAMRKIRDISDICVTYSFCVRLDRVSPCERGDAEGYQR